MLHCMSFSLSENRERRGGRAVAEVECLFQVVNDMLFRLSLLLSARGRTSWLET